MLHLLVALRPEASPFLDAWTLRRAGEARGFDLYEGETADGEPVRLVRSGIGKAAMAAAAGWLAARGSAEETALWLNVGIAGHPTVEVGEALMAHRVVDAGSGRASYPPLVVEPPCATAEVRTVDVPEEAYADDAAYDMEASAFVQAARRFATAELVHCLKIVSDGPGAPASSLDRSGIAELVATRVTTVETLHARLRPLLGELRATEPDAALLDELLSRHHYTVSDQVELRRQLLRHAALAAGEDLPDAVWEARRGREANRLLRAWLDERAAGDRAEAVAG